MIDGAIADEEHGFADSAGDTLPVFGAATGIERRAHNFVAFRKLEEKNTASNEPAPVRGGRDSKVVTLLLSILARVADNGQQKWRKTRDDFDHRRFPDDPHFL